MQSRRIGLNGIGIVSFVLFLLSLPLMILMVLEWNFRSQMTERYRIETTYAEQLNKDPFDDPYNPGTPPFQFGKHKVELKIYPRKNIDTNVAVGDIEVVLNGKRLDYLKNRVLFGGTGEFTPETITEVSVFILHDQKKKKRQLIIMENITDYKIRKGYLQYKYHPLGIDRMTRFRLFQIDEEGNITKEEFPYIGEKTDFQIFMVQEFGSPAYKYTQMNYAWPTFFVPLLYPWTTGLIGFILLPFGFRRTKSRTS